MINLMPPKMKREIAAGRTNVLLWRYCLVSFALAFLLLVMIGAVYFIMVQSKSRAEDAIASGKQRIDEYSEVQQKYDAFAQNLAIAKSILSKDIRYSKLAIRIAQALPSGVILNSLSLDAKEFGKQVVLDAAGRSYVDAVQLKTALEKNPLFTNVNIGSVTHAKDDKGGYAYQIKMNVTIAPGEIGHEQNK